MSISKLFNFRHANGVNIAKLVNVSGMTKIVEKKILVIAPRRNFETCPNVMESFVMQLIAVPAMILKSVCGLVRLFERVSLSPVYLFGRSLFFFICHFNPYPTNFYLFICLFFGDRCKCWALMWKIPLLIFKHLVLKIVCKNVQK